MAHDKQPMGRQAVMAALLESARHHFAVRGTRASLRDIAADADVNLGLIHRHFGNKQQLLHAVLAAQADATAAGVAEARSAGAALRQMFEQAAQSGQFIRIVVAHLLDGQGEAVRREDAPVVAALRALPDERTPEQRDVALMAALAIVYGWTVAGDDLARSFGYSQHAGRRQIEQRLADIVERLAAGSLGEPTMAGP